MPSGVGELGEFVVLQHALHHIQHKRNLICLLGGRGSGQHMIHQFTTG